MENGIDLHSLLRHSALAGAPAAARALEAGWIATATTERPVPCRQIHGMHSARHLALVHPPADRAPEPEHRFANFIARLGGHLSERGWWFRIRGDAAQYFIVFVTVPSLEVLAVFRVDRDVTDSEMLAHLEIVEDAPAGIGRRTLTFMPDYGGAYDWSWRHNSKEEFLAHELARPWMDPFICGVIERHQDALEHWQSIFERCPYGEPQTPEFWKAFHERGRALAWTVKQELGDRVRVIYERPYEQLGKHDPKVMEILADGRWIPFERED